MQAAYIRLVMVQETILWRFRPAQLHSESDEWEWETFTNSLRNGRMIMLHEDLLRRSQPSPIDRTLQVSIVEGDSLETNRIAWLQWRTRLENARIRYERHRLFEQQQVDRALVKPEEARRATEALWRRIVQQRITRSPRDLKPPIIMPRPLPGSPGHLIYKIINHRRVAVGHRYHVWWLGYSPLDSSWVSAEAFVERDQDDLLDTYRRDHSI